MDESVRSVGSGMDWSRGTCGSEGIWFSGLRVVDEWSIGQPPLDLAEETGGGVCWMGQPELGAGAEVAWCIGQPAGGDIEEVEAATGEGEDCD